MSAFPERFPLNVVAHTLEYLRPDDPIELVAVAEGVMSPVPVMSPLTSPVPLNDWPQSFLEV